MKALFNSFKRTHWFKASVTFLTCLSFLILPSCQEDGFDQDPMLTMDNMSPSASAKKILLTGKVKDRDGNWYKTVKIGDQWWMAENLKTTHYNDGILIPNVTDNSEWSALTTGAYCFFLNDEANKKDHGALYNWNTVSTGKLCPKGWHVPSDAEWTILTTFLGGESVAGGALKATGTIEEGSGLWRDPNAGATNLSGFTAIPGGVRNADGSFRDIEGLAHWWSSTEESEYSGAAWNRFIGYGGISVGRDCHAKSDGMSIRCLKGK